MIAKVLQGMNFAGLVDYVDKEFGKSKLLDSEGVFTASRNAIAESFSFQVKESGKTIKDPVGHISLSWHIKDEPKLTEALMVKVAREYMQKMGIVNTQFLVMRHFDQPHPHLHIVYNRIDNDGNRISDSYSHRRSRKAALELTQQYGFHISKGKENVRVDRLRGKAKQLYLMRAKVMQAAENARSWQEFKNNLDNVGIKAFFRSGKDGRSFVGVVFSDGQRSFAGGKLDPTLKFGILDRQFGNQFKPLAYDKPRETIQTPFVQGQKIDQTFVQHMPVAMLPTSAEETSDTFEPEMPTAEADGKDWILVSLEIALIIALNPYDVQVSTGGGGGQSELPWRDRDDEDEKQTPTRRGRRR